MKIGIDVQAAQGPKTGLGVYTENMTRHLKSEFVEKHEFFFYAVATSRDMSTLRRLRWENFELPRLAKKDRLDLLHTAAFSPPYLKPARLVVTVHDLIGMIFPNQAGIPSRFYWGTWLPGMVRRADYIIANSENTKRDILRHLDVPENRISVIYLSGREGFSSDADLSALKKLKQSLGITEKYFLCVGTIEPRKNLLRTFQAFLRFLRVKRPKCYQLVVVGSKEFAHGATFREILRQSPLHSEHIIFTGYIERPKLNLLYCGAEIFLFPSLYEGFGIPVLEAMASGTAVLTSNHSSLPEVAGDAAYKVDPYSIDEICEGMTELSGDPKLRSHFIKKGFEQVRKFSWKKTVEETVKVYESLA